WKTDIGTDAALLDRSHPNAINPAFPPKTLRALLLGRPLAGSTMPNGASADRLPVAVALPSCGDSGEAGTNQSLPRFQIPRIGRRAHPALMTLHGEWPEASYAAYPPFVDRMRGPVWLKGFVTRCYTLLLRHAYIGRHRVSTPLCSRIPRSPISNEIPLLI